MKFFEARQVGTIVKVLARNITLLGHHVSQQRLPVRNLNREDITIGEINPICGKAAMEWVTKAGELAMSGVVDALATAPLNKEAAGLAGYKSIGHMELLQELSKTKLVATMLMAKNLRVGHLSTHRSLSLACELVKKNRILDYLRLTHKSFVSYGFEKPRIGTAFDRTQPRSSMK